MKSKLLPLLVLIALSSLVVAGLINVFGTLAGPFAPPPGEEGEGVWTVCQISAEGGPSPHYLLFRVSGAAHTSYLREMVTTHYDSKAGVWRLESNRVHREYDWPPVTLPHILPPEWRERWRERVQEEIEVVPISSFPYSKLYSRFAPVPTSLYTSSISYPIFPIICYEEENAFFTPEQRLQPYSFTTIHYSFDESTLRQAEVWDVDEVYLDLPSGISGRIKRLAREITADLDSPYEKAKAIEGYLHTNYYYDLYYDRAPWGKEPNDWFLFEEKRGVCANFNSAFVILCRVVGIPARLVSGYLITPQAREQEVYADQAHAWAEVAFSDLGWVTFDATGTPAAPLTPTETRIDEITGAGETFKKGDSFTVKGMVMGMFRYESVPDAQDDTGEEFPPVNTWPKVSVVVPIWDERPLPDMTVQVFLNSWKGPGGLLVGEGETSSEGEFEIKCKVPREISAGDYHVMAKTVATEEYAESWSDPEITVVSDTSIEISLPEEAFEVGETFGIRVALREEPSFWVGEGYEKRWNPVTDEEVELYIDGELIEKVTTDNKGEFVLPYAFTESGTHNVKAEFKGTDYHFASSREVSIWLWPPSAFPWFYLVIPLGLAGALGGYMLWRRRDFSRSHLYFLLILMLVGIGFAAYGLYGRDMYPWIYLAFIPIAAWLAWRVYCLYRQVRGKTPHRGEDVLEISPESESQAEGVGAAEVISITAPVERKKAKEGTLAIDFPQIREPLPDVWGIGDELHISCSIKDGHHEVAAETIEIYLDKNLLSEVQVDESGKGDLAHTIQAKGEYVVGGRLRKSKGERLIRIVDYREEIVNLFNSLLQRVQAGGTDIPSESTPREIQQRLLSAQTGINEKLLEQIMECFEEAEYSQHPMKRYHYEVMFLSWRALFSEE